MTTENIYHMIGKKRIKKVFLFFPFKHNGTWHCMKYVFMVQIFGPMPITLIGDWHDLRIATVDDLIKYL